jgi:hypothetical protein
MREQPLPPDCCYGYVSNHYARLRRRTIVTKPDNMPDLSASAAVGAVQSERHRHKVRSARVRDQRRSAVAIISDRDRRETIYYWFAGVALE